MNPAHRDKHMITQGERPLCRVVELSSKVCQLQTLEFILGACETSSANMLEEYLQGRGVGVPLGFLTHNQLSSHGD